MESSITNVELERRLQAVKVETNGFVLTTILPKQIASIVRLTHDYSHGGDLKGFHISLGGLGLPPDYVSFRMDFYRAQPIYGGIDPEGVVST